MKNRGVVCGLLLLLTAAAALAQPAIRVPDASPAATVGQTIGITDVTINYHRPAVNKRTIFGGLVPYGVVWRAGANEATTFVTSSEVVVGGATVPAGSYTIFTVPAPDKWTLIVNKKTGEWGIPYKYESEELVRIPMSVSKTPSPVENFTIKFDQGGNACTLNISWEETQASVKLNEKK